MKDKHTSKKSGDSPSASTVLSEPYVIKKWMWTDEDFDHTAWHDVKVHALALVNEYPNRLELLLDLDYILKWVDPKSQAEVFSFWLAPATLVFNDVFDLNLSLHSEQLDCEIDYIAREKRTTSSGTQTWLWTMRLHQGTITFWSTGYKLYFRKNPVLHQEQFFSLDERGGISFAQERNRVGGL